MRKLGNDVLRAGVITDAGGGGAAEIDQRGGQVQLLSITQYVAIAPGDPGAAAKITRVAGAQADGVPFTLAHLERDGHAPRSVRSIAEPHADRGEDAEREQVLARFFDRDGGVRLSCTQQQPPAHQPFVYALEPLE